MYYDEMTKEELPRMEAMERERQLFERMILNRKDLHLKVTCRSYYSLGVSLPRSKKKRIIKKWLVRQNKLYLYY